MKRILGAGLVFGMISLLAISNNVNAYSVNEGGEYAVSFNYNIYGEDGVATPANKMLRLDVEEDDTIEIGSLLTDLGFTADSPDKPKNPNSESGAYYWKIAGGEDVAVETISRENFTGFCKIEEGVVISKCARLEVVFPDAIVSEAASEMVEDNGQASMLDGVTGTEISFSKVMPTGAVLNIQELLASDTLKGEIPATLKRILNLAVVRENGEEIEVSENEMTISLALPEELLSYKYFQIVYIVDGGIKETFPAEVVDGKIIFKTSHLSAYGIQASNKPFTTDNAPVMTTMAAETPETGVVSFEDETSGSSKVVTIIAFTISAGVFGVAMLWRKKHSHRIKL